MSWRNITWEFESEDLKICVECFFLKKPWIGKYIKIHLINSLIPNPMQQLQVLWVPKKRVVKPKRDHHLWKQYTVLLEHQNSVRRIVCEIPCSTPGTFWYDPECSRTLSRTFWFGRVTSRKWGTIPGMIKLAHSRSKNEAEKSYIINEDVLLVYLKSITGLELFVEELYSLFITWLAFRCLSC